MNENTLVMRRLIPASRQEVFAAWIDPQSLRHWMCPGDIVSSEAHLEPRVGGRFRIVMKGPKQDYEHTGEYQVFEPPSRLVFTWISKATDVQPTLVTIQLLECGDQTELILTHERFPRADAMERHKSGWGQIAERLAAHLAARPVTRTISHEVILGASPAEVFEALMDAKKHAAFTGAPAEIDRKPGGRFSVYGGHVTGTTVDFQPNERIVQTWRGDRFPAGHFSRVELTLTPLDGGRRTQLSLVHSGVPADLSNEINGGWRDYYWTKMAAYFRDSKVAVVRRFMEEFKNKGNLDIVDELFTSDFVLHLPGTSLPPGPQSQKQVGKAVFDAFTHVRVTVDDTIVEGDRVVERHTARAVHTGEFQGIAATGKSVYWTENHIYRLSDGKIAETWSEVSFHDLLAQLGRR